jgi:hypothetical protein
LASLVEAFGERKRTKNGDDAEYDDVTARVKEEG